MMPILTWRTTNTVAYYFFSLSVLGGFLIGRSDFVPAQTTVICARVLAALAAIVVFIWVAGVGRFGAVARYPIMDKLPPLWRYLFFAPLAAWGVWDLGGQLYGNVVPWFVTALIGRPGITVVTVDGWGGHYYTSPACLYPTLSNIPDEMLGHRALCVYDVARIPPEGTKLKLKGSRSIFGTRVNSFAYP
jgi:hypothetical protein